MHGGTVNGEIKRIRYRGLSPHARGNLAFKGADVAALGPIPACTGEPAGRCNRRADLGAYPRMHGGTSKMPGTACAVRGLSPHARGNQVEADDDEHVDGPIPACTGEPTEKTHLLFAIWAYPRMHGGTMFLEGSKKGGMGLSPHARGNQTDDQYGANRLRPIPACTGEPRWVMVDCIC